MGVISAKGSDARKNAEKESLDFSKVYIRLKDGESVKVRILSPEDYVEYNASGDFNNNIFTQPVAEDSPILKAHKDGGSAFKDMYPRKRYAIAFAELGSGEIKVFDASRNQAKALIGTIEEYRDDLDDYAFTFGRTGKKTSTVYTLTLNLKKTDKEQEQFDKFDDKEVTMDFFEKVLQPNDDNFVIKLLSEIDPDVLDLFPDADLSAFEDRDSAQPDKDSGKAPDISDDNLPF